MSEVRQIEFTEAPYVQIGRDRWYPGDRKAFPKAEADEYIRLGWAKDPATGEQGERKPGAQALQVDDAAQVVGA